MGDIFRPFGVDFALNSYRETVGNWDRLRKIVLGSLDRRCYPKDSNMPYLRNAASSRKGPSILSDALFT